MQEVHLKKKKKDWSTTSPCIPYINYKCLKNLGAYEWVAVHVTRHYTRTPVIRDLPFHIEAPTVCLTPFQVCACQEQTPQFLLSKSIFKDPFGHETQARSEDQVDRVQDVLFTEQKKATSGSWGSAHAEVSCQWPGEKGAVQRAPCPASLSLQPTHAHAIAPLLSGGCLDAVKSCF